MSNFRGIYPILYAFFGKDGKLDHEVMRWQIRACLRMNPQGLAILGLATEVAKLSESKRRQVLEWTTSEVQGKVPLAVTVYGNAVAQQTEFVQAAEEAGADWVILQPPVVKGLSELDYMRFFGAVMEQTDLPVAIQNAPEYLGIGISPQGLQTLQNQHPNFVLLKGEGPAVLMRQVVELTEGRLAVFNGRGGLELPDCLRAGCVGMVPAPECADQQIRIYERMQQGTAAAEREAEALYAEILPLIVFVMQSIEHFLCYGKRILAHRLGVEVFDREPAMQPTDFGWELARRHAERLGPLPDHPA